MASLENSVTGESWPLRAYHVFGRDRARCDTVIDDPWVSRMHAHIRWVGGRWELCDHSSNGTLVSGTLVRESERVALRPGDLIHFSKASAAYWRVGELNDPADMLWPLHPPARPILLDMVCVLPGDTAPVVTVYQSSGGDWLCDDAPAPRVLGEGDEVMSGNLAWRLVLAPARDATLAMPEPSEGDPRLQQLDFTVSCDEEHVEAVLHTRGGTTVLGERAHHYCLVTLARARHAQAKEGYDASSQGWVDLDELARMLGTDVPHVNVLIHRARAQFDALLSPGSAPLVERRRGSVRFGALGFRVFRGDLLDCQSLPAPHADGVSHPPVHASTPLPPHPG